jgi:hypothetical protein
MALTLEKHQRLTRVKLVEFYENNKDGYTNAAKDAYEYIKKGFGGAMVRHDDLVKPLKSVIEIDGGLRAYLVGNKLTQKYWIDDFVYLILDQCWEAISKEV